MSAVSVRPVNHTPQGRRPCDRQRNVSAHERAHADEHAAGVGRVSRPLRRVARVAKDRSSQPAERGRAQGGRAPSLTRGIGAGGRGDARRAARNLCRAPSDRRVRGIRCLRSFCRPHRVRALHGRRGVSDMCGRGDSLGGLLLHGRLTPGGAVGTSGGGHCAVGRRGASGGLGERGGYRDLRWFRGEEGREGAGQVTGGDGGTGQRLDSKSRYERAALWRTHVRAGRSYQNHTSCCARRRRQISPTAVAHNACMASSAGRMRPVASGGACMHACVRARASACAIVPAAPGARGRRGGVGSRWQKLQSAAAYALPLTYDLNRSHWPRHARARRVHSARTERAGEQKST